MRWLVLVVVAGGCVREVRQDAATGTDGQLEGATSMAWTSADRTSARGDVSYPRGDRVDWYSLRLDTRANVEIELRWSDAGPRSRLEFEVFDAEHELVARSRFIERRARHAELPDARGELFVRVYAVGRPDCEIATSVGSYIPEG